jgi:hypothetical protein
LRPIGATLQGAERRRAAAPIADCRGGGHGLQIVALPIGNATSPSYAGPIGTATLPLASRLTAASLRTIQMSP